MPNYTQINWVDNETLLNAENLNHMDKGIQANSEEINKNTTSINAVSDKVNDVSTAVNNIKVNNSTITIQQGSTTKGTFTLNQSENVTIEIDAPPSASKTLPKPDGEASYGAGKSWSRADHVHPQNAFTEINVGDTSITSSFNASNLNLVGSDGISLSTSERNITFKANKVTLTLTEVNNTISSYKIIKGHLEYNVTINGTLYPIVVTNEGPIENINYNNPLKLDVGTYVVSNNIGATSSSTYFEVGNYYCELDLTNPGIYNLSYTDIISSTFSENDWKTIAKAARTGEARKRWKVGDYKMLSYPSVDRPAYVIDSTNTHTAYFLTAAVNGGKPAAQLTLKSPTKFISVVGSNPPEYNDYRIRVNANDNGKARLINKTDTENHTIAEYKDIWTLCEALDIELKVSDTTHFNAETIIQYGIHTPVVWSYQSGQTYPATQYPIMILGFDHDNVSTPYTYGKQKAGMTLCLGITRAVTENSPPYHWDTAVLPNLYESGTSQFDAANGDNTLMSPYWLGDGKTNWEMCQFREALQHLLDDTELEDKIIPVEKITAAGLWQENNNYFPKTFTNDKVSLLSEYEIIGGVKFSNAQEGDQYEFFKRGNSRFYWNTVLVNYGKWGDPDVMNRLYLWLRSPINPKSFNNSGVEKPLEYPGGCNLQCSLVLKGTTSDNSIATITNPYLLMENALLELLAANDSIYDYTYTVTILKNTDSGTISASIDSSAGTSRSFSDSTLERIKEILLNTYGITVYSEQPDITFTFTISRNEQVGYAQGANGRTPKGSLLPIFCL